MYSYERGKYNKLFESKLIVNSFITI
jgi:hypothetical protein